VQAQVIWSRPGELGVAFVDLYQTTASFSKAWR